MIRKLTDIKGDESIDVLAGLIGLLAAMATDPAVQDIASSGKKLGRGDVLKLMPNMIKNHKAELVEILTLLSGDADYSATMTAAGLIEDCSAMLQDRDVLQLFI